MAYVEVNVDIEDYLDEVSTGALKDELTRRKVFAISPLPEPPSHVIADLKKAFERKDPHEFYFVLRKAEMYLEAIDE